jgi:hypothetical protein
MQKNVPSKVELAKSIISIVISFNNVRLSTTELNVLAYFIVYGVSPQTKQLIIKSEICKNISNIKTIMVKLKKLELIYKDELNSKVYVNKIFNFGLTPKVGFYLKLDIAEG